MNYAISRVNNDMKIICLFTKSNYLSSNFECNHLFQKDIDLICMRKKHLFCHRYNRLKQFPDIIENKIERVNCLFFKTAKSSFNAGDKRKLSVLA